MKKIILMLMLAIALLVLTGCDDEIKQQIYTDLTARSALNIEKVKALVEANLLDKTSGDLIIQDINEKMKYVKQVTEEDINKLEPYVSWHIRGNVSANGQTFKTEVTEYLGYEQTFSSADNIQGKIHSSPKALSLVGGDYIKDLQDTINYTVAELNISGDVALDDVMTAIKNAKEAQSSGDEAKIRSAFNKLNTYFKDTGKKLCTDPLIINTKLGDVVNWWYGDDKGKIQNIQALSAGDSVNKQLGTDFRIKGRSGIPEIAIRLEEFNTAVIDKLIGLDGVAVNEYLVHNKTVYKLKYNINTINAVSLDPSNDNRYTTSLKSTNQYLNLLTGEITDSAGRPLIQSGGQIIKIGGTGAQGDKGISSFVLSGSKIVLRDYLEYTYMPGVVSGEKWVALGRRLRVERLSGSMEDVFASVVNKDGVTATGIAKVYPTDLISILSDFDSTNAGKAIKLGVQENIETEDAEGSGTGFVTDGETSSLLETHYKDTIYPIMKLGSDIIATDDKDAGENGKIVLYGLCVDKNPFTNGLYKSWIEGADSEFGNLGWWMAWLGSNRYKYKIDANALGEFLMENYSFELRKEGYIILDTEVIKKIQMQYNQEDKENRVNGVRTAFVILGLILMAYALVLLASWTFDVNTVTGPRLMSTLTFQKWEAIQDSSELPQMEVADKHYMTFSKTLQSCMIIMALGFLLVIVDIVQVVIALIDIFGGVGQIIYKVIFGGK